MKNPAKKRNQMAEDVKAALSIERLGALDAAIRAEAAAALRNSQVGGNHYISKTIQPWDAMEAWMRPDEFSGYLRGNVIKYMARCNDKGGREDLEKARHYLNKLISIN